MANRKRDAGRSAERKKAGGVATVVNTPYQQVYGAGDVSPAARGWAFRVLHGSYSSSLLFDTLPLTDPAGTTEGSPVDIFPLTVALTGQ